MPITLFYRGTRKIRVQIFKDVVVFTLPSGSLKVRGGTPVSVHGRTTHSSPCKVCHWHLHSVEYVRYGLSDMVVSMFPSRMASVLSVISSSLHWVSLKAGDSPSVPFPCPVMIAPYRIPARGPPTQQLFREKSSCQRVSEF